MIAELLLETIEIKEFMEAHGYQMHRIGGRTGYITTCPFCGKPDHCGINPATKFFGCYKCHESGNFVKLLQKILNRRKHLKRQHLKLKINNYKN